MSVSSATFLAGAKGRLMPAGLIFRFFLAAAVFHVAAWAVLYLAADGLPYYRGGTGAALSAIHLLTLGVLVMSVIGASLQLLSVVTKRPIGAHGLCRLISWLYIPGVAVLTAGMGRSDVTVMAVGGGLVTLALFLFMAIIGGNLRRASGIGVTAAYTWTALGALFLLTTLGASLISNYEYGWISDHAGHAVAHFLIAVFGFMGLLAFGFSHVLVPMFALSPAPAKGQSYAALALIAAAVLAAAFGASVESRSVMIAALAAGVGGLVLHLRGMAGVLAGRMRKRMGLSFKLVRAAWILLPLSLLWAALGLAGGLNDRWPTLFGFLLLAGWLLTFLLGMLQRIMPFLATMHSGKGSTLSVADLTPRRPLQIHAGLHGVAVLLVAAGIGFDEPLLIRTGAGLGTAGALLFLWFAVYVIRRMRQAASMSSDEKAGEP